MALSNDEFNFYVRENMEWDEEERKRFKRLRLKRAEDCLGKTVAQSYMGSGEFAFAFSDGTFFLCQAFDDYGDLGIDTYSVRLSVGLAHDLGLISGEVYERKRAESQARVEAEELARYEELRKKYGKFEGSGE